MGHKSKKSLLRQVQEKLQGKLSPSDSKHLDKQTPGTTDGKIYSYNTFRTYLNVGAKFTQFCKNEYGCKTVDDCRQYVNEYLEHRSSYCSAYTTKLDAAALAKLYGESSTNFNPTPSRSRSEVTRSRGEKEMDKHFSESRNAELVSFLSSTGLRRSEAACVRGSDLRPVLTVHAVWGSLFAPLEPKAVGRESPRCTAHWKLPARLSNAVKLRETRNSLTISIPSWMFTV